MLSISPNTFTITEYVPFVVTYTISSDDPSENVGIEEVTITVNGADVAPDLTITHEDDNSFTVSGVISDVFNRSMAYLDVDDAVRIVSRFEDIPENFHTLYKYVGATTNSITASVSVTTNVGTMHTHIIINNNFNAANAKLIEYVQKGVF